MKKQLFATLIVVYLAALMCFGVTVAEAAFQLAPLFIICPSIAETIVLLPVMITV